VQQALLWKIKLLKSKLKVLESNIVYRLNCNQIKLDSLSIGLFAKLQ